MKTATTDETGKVVTLDSRPGLSGLQRDPLVFCFRDPTPGARQFSRIVGIEGRRLQLATPLQPNQSAQWEIGGRLK